MRLNYNQKGLSFKAANLQEALMVSECFQAENVYDDSHSWHQLVTRNEKNVQELNAVDSLRIWGLEPTDGIETAQQVLDSKRKRYNFDTRTLDEVKETLVYKRALDLIISQFGKPLKDGRVIFPYQLETAALMIAKKRLLLALDMGLGKTITALIGLLSDSSNRKILIITMSRNINDWEREVEALGFEDDYLVVSNPTDLKSDKRIHIVSYEKWSIDRITFVRKPCMECPDCGTSHSRGWKRNLGYCYVCKTKHDKFLEERWSEKDLPKECPSCKKGWKGHYTCECGYGVIESRKEPLYKAFHNGYDACAIDEGHYIKNGQSKRGMAVRRVNTTKRYLLSGTPAENGADDLYWQLGWLTGFSSRFEDPVETDSGKPKPFQGYGKVGEEHFREFYSGGKKRRVLDIDSVEPRASNHEKLWAILDGIMVRMKKTDKGVAEYIEVPKPEHHRMHLTLHDAERELYDEILNNFREWYELEQAKKEAAEARGDKYRISTIEICAWMDKLRKAASSPWQFETYDASKGVTTTKLEYLKNKAKDYLRRGKKMLVFSGHKETVEQLGMLMDGVVPGKGAAYIHGGVKMEYRWELMKKFQDPNDPLSILIMSHRTGAESYTLTEAKAVCLFDLDFNAKKIEQCYSRAVRLGQRDVVDIYWLLGVDTIDINMHGLVLSKASGVNLAIDREELNFSELAKEFEGDTPVFEDLNCLDELFGEYNFKFRLLGEKESQVRGKSFADSDMEFPHGMYENFEACDWEILGRLKRVIKELAEREDTAIVLPIGYKEHIDHFIVREAGITVAKELGVKAKAKFYFAEDKPYSGIANEVELERIKQFVSDNNLDCKAYRHHPDKVIDVSFKHYVSQVEEVYITGINHRSDYLKSLYAVNHPVDRIYTFNA